MLANATIDAVKGAVLKANAKLYSLVQGFGCVAVVSALTVKPFHQSHRSNETAAKLENERTDVIADARLR
jgi:hypothetical protein